MDAQVNAQQAQNTTQPTKPAVTLTKVEKPMLDAYVVSSCPYGLQMQRAMSDAVKNVPSLASYFKVRYIGSVVNGVITAMHGDGEAKENLRQICIRDEQQSKYWNYVSCYMKKATDKMPNGMPLGDSPTCQAEAGIDTAKLNSCVSNPSRGLTYAKEDFAMVAKLNDTPECKADPNKCAVAGSPSLILNGTKVSEFDFGGRSADSIKTIICESSLAKPDFCSTKLSTDQAATSFSVASTTSAGSSANAAACAPATN